MQSTTTSSMNHSSSTSNHQHTHHHTHHHERMSPGSQLLGLRHGMHAKMPQTNPHHLMIQPPSLGHHGPLGEFELIVVAFLFVTYLLCRSSYDGKQLFGSVAGARSTGSRKYAKSKCTTHSYKFPHAFPSQYSHESVACH